ncbi:MAG: alpha/beta hydrolase [Chitinophagaceae bacterium]|nr:MAG: alpha/beta hydrolase [Chitinophagaceae bacterium]
MRKILLVLLVLVGVLILGYMLGPAPSTPLYDKKLHPVPAAAATLESFVRSNESKHKLKPDNQARIIWNNDSAKAKTPYSIVYLHGFSASQAEGDPIHKNIARDFGCNLYLSRLAEHGIDTTESMMNLTADKYWESAKEALEIGKQLGEKVILLGTSTGGTNAIQLAAAYPDQVAALILLSPNIAINDPSAFLLNNPWGLQIAKTIIGSPYITSQDKRPINMQYWDTHYRLEAAVALQELLETSMTRENFEKITMPTLLLYYYKDEIRQDSTVKVSAMKEMFDEISTPAAQKKQVAMPNAGTHVIGSYIRSNDVAGVQKQIEDFFQTTLGLKKVQ